MALLLAFAAPRPAAAETERAAVVVVSSVNTTDFAARQIREQLGRALGARYRVAVVAADQVDTALRGVELPADCATSPRCMADIGSKVGADQLLLLSLARVGSSVRVDSVWAAADGSATRMLPSFVVKASDVGAGLPAGLRDTEGDEGQPTGLWVATGVSAAALTSAVVLSILAQSHYDEHVDVRGGEDARDTQWALNIAADASWGLALAGGLMAGYYLFVHDDGAGEPQPVPPSGPWAAASREGGLSLGWSGRF